MCSHEFFLKRALNDGDHDDNHQAYNDLTQLKVIKDTVVSTLTCFNHTNIKLNYPETFKAVESISVDHKHEKRKYFLLQMKQQMLKTFNINFVDKYTKLLKPK